MLYLTRKIGESIRIGDAIEIQLADVKGKTAKIGLRFPAGIPVLRGEVYERVHAENTAAAGVDTASLLQRFFSGE